MEDESSSLSLEPLTPVTPAGGGVAAAASPSSRCVVCGTEIAHLAPAEREAHVNACLDGQGLVCAICHKAIAHLDSAGRNAHVSRCMDQSASAAPPVTAASAARAGENRLDGRAYFCVVCNKDLSAASVTARGQHVKSCAKKNKTEMSEMRSLANGITEAPAPAPKRTEEVYRDPVSGFTRRLGAVASGQKKQRRKKRDDNMLEVGDDEELAHIAIALAASLGTGCESGDTPNHGRGGGANDNEGAGVPLRSLQMDPVRDHVDLAGFAVPSLTQVVNEVAPPIAGGNVAPASNAAVGSVSKFAANASKSLWKKASERPNVEAGLYVSVERTPLLPQEPETPAADPTPMPETTPLKRHKSNRLEIPASLEERVRHELANISNAYSRSCREALAAAQSAVASARADYFSAIGKSAVVRDTAVAAIMARNMLHEGHADALPMMSYAAEPFPEPPKLHLPPEAPFPEIGIVAPKKREEPEEDDGMLMLAGCVEESPPKNPRKDKEEMSESPIRPSVIIGLDTPAGGVSAIPPPPTPPNLTPQQQQREAEGGISLFDVNSQPPNWDTVGAEELKKRMAEFGLQAGTEKFMRGKLKEIWDYQHSKRMTNSLAIAKQVQARLVPDGDVVTPVRPMAKLDAPEKPLITAPAPVTAVVEVEAPADVEEGDGDDDLTAANAASGPPAQWEEKILAFIKGGPYWERMLLFEPIPLQQLLEDIKYARVVSKLTKKVLAAFLDKKGVIYDDPLSKWKRK